MISLDEKWGGIILISVHLHLDIAGSQPVDIVVISGPLADESFNLHPRDTRADRVEHLIQRPTGSVVCRPDLA